MARTPGPWRLGKSGGSVVCDTAIRPNDDLRDVGLYGGYLVAESIAREDDARLIAQAPDFDDVFRHPSFRSLELVKRTDYPGGAAWCFELAVFLDGHVQVFHSTAVHHVVTEVAAVLRRIRDDDLHQAVQQTLGRALVPVAGR